MADNVLGIDLSDYRLGVDLKAAKQKQVRFVISKATQGTTIVHQANEEYRAKAAAVNMPFGNYAYWDFKVDAVAQAKFYVKHLGVVRFRPIVDVERYGNRKSTGGPLVSVQANINHLAIVLNTIEQLTGVQPMIYTNWATWNELFGNTKVFAKYEMWVANYGRPTPFLPDGGWPKWTIWQWTSAWALEGYPRGLDANWFNGNEAAFEAYLLEMDKLWGRIVEPPPPPPPPVDPPSADIIVVGSIVRVNGNEELFVLGKGDTLTLRVEEFGS